MEKENHIIISLGGSLIVPDEVDSETLNNFIEIIKEYIDKGFNFVIITGGGKLCRHYQSAYKFINGEDKESLDWLGIHSTRFNAEFLKLLFGKLAHSQIILDPNIVPQTDKPVILGGGWKPGWSTDFDAVIIAEKLRVKKVINLSNIDFAYNKDPKKYSDAVPIRESSWKEFRNILPKEWNPGLNVPFDPIAAEKAEELGLEVVIMNGKNLTNFKNYLENKQFIGTIIK